MAIDILGQIKANPGKLYAYGLYRPCGQLFYVGIGRGRRVLDHETPAYLHRARLSLKAKTIRGILAGGQAVGKQVLGWFDTWEQACEFERRLIAEHGRIDNGTGILANHTDGGEGVVNLSGGARERLLRHVANLADRTRGQGRAPEVVEKLKAAWVHRSRHVPEEVRQRIREKLAGKPLPDDTRRKMSESHKGLERSEEHCRNLSAALSKRPIVCVETGQVFPSLPLAEAWLVEQGISSAKRQNIHKVCQGKRKRAYGYGWRYA